MIRYITCFCLDFVFGGLAVVLMTGEAGEEVSKEFQGSSVDFDREKFLRLQAEFANYKKRVEKEKAEVEAFSNARLLKELVDLNDSFEKAFSLSSGDVVPVSGLSALREKLLSILSSEGVELIAPKKGDKFNPLLHHAVSVQRVDGFDEGVVVEIVKNGFKIKGVLFEPALVIISSKSVEEVV